MTQVPLTLPLTFYALFRGHAHPMATAQAGSIWDVVAEAGRRSGETPDAVAWWEVDADREMEAMAVREDGAGVCVRAERTEEGWRISWEVFRGAPDDPVTVASGDDGGTTWDGRAAARRVMWEVLRRLALGPLKEWERGGDPFVSVAASRR